MRLPTIVLLACSTAPQCFPQCRDESHHEPEVPEHTADLESVCFPLLERKPGLPHGAMISFAVDADGAPDLVSAEDGTLVLRRGGPQGFGDAESLGEIESSPLAFHTGDLDGDGIVDLVMVVEGAAILFLGDGNTLVPSEERVTLADDVTDALAPRFAVADLDGDGDAAMVIGRERAIYVRDLGTSDEPGETTLVFDGLGIDGLAAAELDGDAAAELVVLAGPRLFALAVDGEDASTLWTTDAPEAFAVADLDEDGRSEIVGAFEDEFRIYSTTGTTPREIGAIAVGAGDPRPHGPMTVVDLDGDGAIDVLAGSGAWREESSCGGLEGSFGAVDIWLGNGRAGWIEHEVEEEGRLVVDVVDLDGDGRRDISFNGGGVSLAEDCGT